MLSKVNYYLWLEFHVCTNPIIMWGFFFLLSFSRDDDMFDVTGDDLRQLAKKVDTYARNNEIQSL